MYGWKRTPYSVVGMLAMILLAIIPIQLDVLSDIKFAYIESIGLLSSGFHDFKDLLAFG